MEVNMDYQNYIKAELLVLIPVLYFIGIGFKKSHLPDKWIPLTLGGVSVVLSTIWIIATTDISTPSDTFSALFTAVTQGILIAGASVYTNQIYLQSHKEE